jgi:hypothetical protein
LISDEKHIHEKNLKSKTRELSFLCIVFRPLQMYEYTLLLYIARPIVKGSYRKTTFQASPSQAFSVEGFITFSTLF